MKLGNTNIEKAFFGTTEIKKIFSGTTQVWANDPYEPFIYFPETNYGTFLKLHKMNKSDLSIASSVTITSGTYDVSRGIHVDATYIYVCYDLYIKKYLKSNLSLVATSIYVGNYSSNKALNGDSSNLYLVKQQRLLVLSKSTMNTVLSYYAFSMFTSGNDVEPGGSQHLVVSDSILGALNSSTMSLDSSVSVNANGVVSLPNDVYIANDNGTVVRYNRGNFSVIATSSSFGENVYRVAISDQIYARGQTKIKKLDWTNLTELYSYKTASGLALAVDNDFVYVEDAGKIKKLNAANLSYVSQSSVTFNLIIRMVIPKA